MKLAVFSILFGDRSFEEALDVIAENKLEAVEGGTGGFLGDVHCKVEELLHNEEKLQSFKHAIESRELLSQT